MDNKQDRWENGDSAGYFQPDTAQADFAYWAKMPVWKQTEAASLFLGCNPNFITYGVERSSTLEAQYRGLLDLANRATDDRRFGWPLSPARWLAWAKNLSLPMPPALEAEIVRWTAKDNGPVLPTSNANVAKRCEEWLRSEMKKSPQARPKRKREFQKDANELFKGLTQGEFNQAWVNAKESTGALWGAPGRPRKSIQKSCQKS